MAAIGPLLITIFTFHDVSINTLREFESVCDQLFFTFHDVSINTIVDQGRVMRYVTLHSTMFLLILDSDFKEMYSSLSSLHSTMFLLIPVSTGNGMRWGYFTFHDVSINTSAILVVPVSHSPLHSTMFLLILYQTAVDQWGWLPFTFHDVSINTQSWIRIWKKFFLYIPRCFY